ncbi:MAG: acyl-ACP--UDP-N-acetylglucosamine O-acyltransferase [Candidatus Aminicenantes bacterium]|nr:acyl-ACP--UDP-N-acetylglucosamine O-acyltransferase [Candidatus Aminicenantes bacterium]MCK4496461.1 acyl-ACP--UDP-N-acetylglucosamine O-acyltransferase [Candidatus Aminicenantes bacterium]
MGENDISLHPTSTIHPKAQIDSGVWVGPYCFIGEKVSIHKNTRIDANVYIDGLTEIGEDCHFSPFSSIGTEPQDVTYKGEETLVKIGDRNIFREFVTVHRGTVKGREKTIIGNDNYFMVYSHIAHDCYVGNETIFTHGATLGGHVTIEDYTTVGALSGVHQFCRVGKYAFIGGFSVITQDVLPYCRVAGSRPPVLYGLNAIGLRRRGFSRERIRILKRMFKIIFYSDLNTSQAVERIREEFSPGEERDEIINFIQDSRRGIIKKTSEKWDVDLG